MLWNYAEFAHSEAGTGRGVHVPLKVSPRSCLPGAPSLLMHVWYITLITCRNPHPRLDLTALNRNRMALGWKRAQQGQELDMRLRVAVWVC